MLLLLFARVLLLYPEVGVVTMMQGGWMHGGWNNRMLLRRNHYDCFSLRHSASGAIAHTSLMLSSLLMLMLYLNCTRRLSHIMAVAAAACHVHYMMYSSLWLP
jgi:hypothetical protein